MKNFEKSNVSTVEIDRYEQNEFNKLIKLKFKIDDDLIYMQSLSLLDSGSPITFIEEKFINSVLIEKVETDSLNYAGINESKLNIIGKVIINCTWNRVKKPTIFYVVTDDTMSPNAILGRDFFRNFTLKVIETSNQNSLKENEIFNIDISNSKDKILDDLIINSDIPDQIQNNFKEIFDVYYINAVKPSEPKKNSENNEPFFFKLRRLSFTEKQEVKVIIDVLLNRDIIRPSNSEYCSPIVLTKKKNGQTRICGDFRSFNKII